MEFVFSLVTHKKNVLISMGQHGNLPLVYLKSYLNLNAKFCIFVLFFFDYYLKLCISINLFFIFILINRKHSNHGKLVTITLTHFLVPLLLQLQFILIVNGGTYLDLAQQRKNVKKQQNVQIHLGYMYLNQERKEDVSLQEIWLHKEYPHEGNRALFSSGSFVGFLSDVIFEKEECIDEGYFWIDAAENKEECLENVLGRFGCLLPRSRYRRFFFYDEEQCECKKGFYRQIWRYF